MNPKVATALRVGHFILTLVLGFVIIVLVTSGLAQNLSFDNWLPTDLVVAVISLLLSGGMALRKDSKMFIALFIIPLVMISSFVLHLEKPYWVLIDLGSIGVAIAATVRSWPTRRYRD